MHKIDVKSLLGVDTTMSYALIAQSNVDRLSVAMMFLEQYPVLHKYDSKTILAGLAWKYMNPQDGGRNYVIWTLTLCKK